MIPSWDLCDTPSTFPILLKAPRHMVASLTVLQDGCIPPFGENKGVKSMKKIGNHFTTSLFF